MSKAKSIGAAAGSLLLMSSGALMLAPAIQAQAHAHGVEVSQEQQVPTAQAGNLRVSSLQGEFSYDQVTLTPTDTIKNVFSTAAATLCASLPDYRMPSTAIAVNGDAVISADQLAEESGGYTPLACSCASNVAGGGATVNAAVGGITVERLMALMGV